MHPILKQRTSLAIYLAASALGGALFAMVLAGGDSGLWLTAMTLAVPVTVVYSLACLSTWYLCQANPLSSSPLTRIFGVQFTGSLLSAGLMLGLAKVWSALLAGLPGLENAPDLFATHQLVFFAAGVLLYLLAATLNYLLLAFESSRQAKERALELEVLAREAELQAFRNQIDPHFLFNCLNSISSLCGTDPASARHTAIRLGEFLRASLRLGSDDTISLREELELCAAYLDVERVRFGDRLAYHQEVSSECMTARVPALLLQPLLENALKHGIAHLVEGGKIRLEASLVDREMRISVVNSCDPDRPESPGAGIGLANVKGRLALIYDGHARFSVESEPSTFTVTLRLPTSDAVGTEQEVSHG